MGRVRKVYELLKCDGCGITNMERPELFKRYLQIDTGLWKAGTLGSNVKNVILCCQCLNNISKTLPRFGLANNILFGKNERGGNSPC